MTKMSIKEIKKKGISKFRNSSSIIGCGYADNYELDRRISMNYSSFFKRVINNLIQKFPRVSLMQDSQVSLSNSYYKEYKKMRSMYANKSDRIKDLINEFPINFETTRFECDNDLELNGQIYSAYYLEMLSRIKFFSGFCDFKSVTSFVEIGGGFGAFAHLILELFPNIKTYYYVDIAPNLYVGSNYLRSFYKESVHDYLSIKSLYELPKSNNNSRKIYCLPPWDIKKIPESSIDLFHNASSFVEMPSMAVKNYASIIEKFLSSNGKILLQTYKNFDLETTFHPDQLPSFFESLNFDCFREEDLFDAQSKSYFYISKQK